MKKIQMLISFVFTLGIMCLGFSFASKNFGLYNAFAYSSQIVLENSTFDMAGGTISNAIGDNGGAVYVGDGATFTMTGGKIKNCTATNGGAVYVADGGIFNFDGGTIENCSADLGYAIYVQAGGTLNYENNENGFIGCGEDQDLHIYAEEGAIVIAPGVNINIYVDGTLSKTIKKSGDTYTIDEAEMPLDYESCCGYFYDSKLSQCTNGVVDLTRVETASTFTKRTANTETPAINIYTRTANPNNFTIYKDSTIGKFVLLGRITPPTGDVVLPKEYENEEVIIYPNPLTISDAAFYQCTQMTSITFPDGITSIPNYSFWGATGLTGELVIPDSVITLGESAFRECSGITSLSLGENITTIGNGVFWQCSGISGVINIPQKTTSLGDSVFYGCSKIEEVSVENATIGNSVFRACSSLTKVYMGDGVKSIGEFAFFDSPQITEMNMGNGVQTIGTRAFDSCSSWSGDLFLPEALVSIGDMAFFGCSSLTGELIIPNNVTNVGYYAFLGCEGLSGRLIVGNKVETIGHGAFRSNTGLTTAYIPTRVTTINGSSYTDSLFLDCSTTMKIYCEASSKPDGWYVGWNYHKGGTPLETIWGCSLDSDGNIVTPPAINFYVDGTYHSSFIPGGTSYTVVESDMPLEYENCCGYFLDDIYMTTIKNNTIDLSNGDVNLYTRTANCPSDYFIYNLDSITNTYWINPRRYSGGGADFISKTKRMTVTATNHYVIPKEYLGLPIVEVKGGGQSQVNLPTYSSVTLCDNITSIGDNAFFYADKLTAVNVHDGITKIGDYAFYSCSLLSGRLIIPNSVTSIGKYAFDSCSGLTSVTIPDSVTSIGISAFSYCSGLTEVKVSSGNTVYEDRGKNAIIEKSTNTIIQGFNCTDLSVLEEVTSIGDSAFRSCSGLTGELIIPDSVTIIGNSAFYECSGLTGNLIIPDSVTSIGDSAFRSCSGLTGSLIIPDSVTSIGDSAFRSCSGLTGSLIIPDSVTSIGDSVFYNCSGLTGSLIIPDSVTSIGSHAFYSCSRLTSATIGNSVTSIGNYAFEFCSGLTSVYIPSSVTTISAPYSYNAPFYSCSSSLVIYTDVANASSKPSSWGSYWNYKSSSATYTTNYGYTLEQYKSAVGLTFAPSGEKLTNIEVTEDNYSYQVDNAYLQTIMPEKREYIAILKENEKIA